MCNCSCLEENEWGETVCCHTGCPCTHESRYDCNFTMDDGTSYRDFVNGVRRNAEESVYHRQEV